MFNTVNEKKRVIRCITGTKLTLDSDNFPLVNYMVAGTTSATTFKVRLGAKGEKVL